MGSHGCDRPRCMKRASKLASTMFLSSVAEAAPVRMAPSLAPATVPEYTTCNPKLSPRLTPETM